MLLPDYFTFFSAPDETTSLDHCVSTDSGKSIISDICIKEDFACSVHFPLCVTVLCDIFPIRISTGDNEIRNIPKWNQVSDSDIYKYKCYTHKLSVISPYPLNCCCVKILTLPYIMLTLISFTIQLCLFLRKQHVSPVLVTLVKTLFQFLA